MGRVLATGDFDCRTRICTHIITGAQYAVRIYDKLILAEASWMWNQTREAVQVMRTLPKHENIVEMVECFETENSLYILMQLHAPLHVTKMFTTQKEIPLSRTKQLFTQVVRGIMHMHDNGVVHCGIAPDHILVNDRDQVKIGFLVSCRFYQRGKNMTGMRGTKHSVAPEVLRQEPYNPVLADSWSLGVLLFFMLNGGQYPHDGANTTKNILNHKVRQLNPALPVQARDLVNQLLTYDPEERLAVGDIFNHPWMLDDRAEEDAEFQQRNLQARHSTSGVESNYDASNDMISITLPYGLSQEEEAAYIIQHMWKAYQRRKNSAGDSVSLSLVQRVPHRAASLRLKRVASTIKHVPGGLPGRRKSQAVEGTAAPTAAERRISRNSVVSLPTPAHGLKGQFSRNTFSSISSSPGAGGGQPHQHSALSHSQCAHCGRMPPQRLHPGKSPYPAAKFTLLSTGEFVPVEPKPAHEMIV
jgi:serine/threonine protein kinase